ncbi:MAG: hypothetical protein EBR82_87705 [Caulobacteraceae bacterium]|nr:hypothetical protein [Caulobacteraceae bacterium]
MIAKPETDTPETDAAILREINAKLSFGLTGYTAKASGQFVDAEFARKLERERDMSLYDATQETLKVSALKSQWIAVCQERDAAENESLEMARLLGMSGEREAALLARLDEANREIARLQMELDATCNAEELRQARQERDQWCECAEDMAQIIDDLHAHDEPTIIRINTSVDRFRRLKKEAK